MRKKDYHKRLSGSDEDSQGLIRKETRKCNDCSHYCSAQYFSARRRRRIVPPILSPMSISYRHPEPRRSLLSSSTGMPAEKTTDSSESSSSSRPDGPHTSASLKRGRTAETLIPMPHRLMPRTSEIRSTRSG